MRLTRHEPLVIGGAVASAWGLTLEQAEPADGLMGEGAEVASCSQRDMTRYLRMRESAFRVARERKAAGLPYMPVADGHWIRRDA